MREHYSNLVAEEIKLLASEDSSTFGTDVALNNALQFVDLDVRKRFLKGKRIKLEDLKPLMDKFDDKISKLLCLIETRKISIKTSKTKAIPDSYENSYVGIIRRTDRLGSDHLFQLYSLQLNVARRYVNINFQPLPYAVRYHAASRLMERSENEVRPISSLAHELYRWIPAIRAMYRQAEKVSDSHIYLPFDGDKGLILGEFTKFIDKNGGVLCYGKNQTKKYCNKEIAKQPMFVINTFVDYDSLFDIQIDTLNLLSDWYRDNSKECEIISEKITWPLGVNYDYEDFEFELKKSSQSGLNKIMSNRFITNAMKPTNNYKPYIITQEFPSISGFEDF